MNRREFIKLGMFAVPAMYLSPEALCDLTAGDIEGPAEGGPGTSRVFFRGRHSGEMRAGQVTLPEAFKPSLAKTKIHFFGEERSGCLRLIPDSLFHEEAFQREWAEASRSISDGQLCYFGEGLVSGNGRLGIPEWVREQAGMADGEVVIVGFLAVIEMWDKQKWDAEYQRVMEAFPSGSISLPLE